MSDAADSDRLLVERIRLKDEGAWSDLISRYEGRLTAFVESRLGRRAPAEDIVQEAFVGFLTSLPNFDGRRSVESYLFSICAYKLTDHLRREGRRPTISMNAGPESSGPWELPGHDRVASSIARSGERRNLEERAIVDALHQQILRWKERGDWTKLRCVELLIVRGWANKDVADELSISEQQVANFKFDFLARMKTLVRRQDVPKEVFPELHEDE